MSGIKYYKLAPVSKTVFTIVETDGGRNIIGPVQSVDVEKLNENALHKALYILRTKLDRDLLGTATDAWLALPQIQSSKYDAELAKKFSAQMLRAKIEYFLNVWYIESIEKRKEPLAKLEDKFKAIPGWPTLHTVKPPSVADSQLVIGPNGNPTIEPRQCAIRLQELRQRIGELAETVKTCTTVQCAQDAVAEIHDKEKVLCTTSL